MSGTSINNLTYTGTVTLSRYNGKDKKVIQKVKNTGGTRLFKFFSNCLIGEFTAAAEDRPVKIMLVKKTALNSETYTYTPKSGFIYLLTLPEKLINKDSARSVIRYSFIVPKEYLAVDFNGIGLYAESATTQEAGDYSAFSDVDLIIETLPASSVLVVDWELTIQNSVGTATDADA